MTIILTKTASNGQEVRIEAHRHTLGHVQLTSYIGGKYDASQSHPYRLPQPLVKGSVTYTHHVGTAGLTTAEVEQIEAAIATEREARKADIAAATPVLYVSERDPWGEYGEDSATLDQLGTATRSYTGAAYQQARDLAKEHGEQLPSGAWKYAPTAEELATLNAAQDQIDQRRVEREEHSRERKAQRDAIIASFSMSEQRAWYKYEGNSTEATMGEDYLAAASIASINKRLAEAEL